MSVPKFKSLILILIVGLSLNFENNAFAKTFENVFSPISQCTLKAYEDESSPANAFRTGIRNLQTFGDINILILRIDFLDLPWEDKSDFEFPKLILNLNHFYETASKGRLKISGNIYTEIIRMEKLLNEYNARDRNALDGVAKIMKDALDMLSEDVNAAEFDYVIIAPPSSTRVVDISTSISYLDDGTFPNATILGGDYWQSGRPWTIPAHEMGHAFGLLDLYSYEVANEVSNGLASNLAQFKFMGPYELMNWPTGLGPEFGAWNRWQLGYLSEQEVGCVKIGQSVSTLFPISRSGKLRALFIKLDESKLLVVENRQRTGLDKSLPINSVGLVIYLVNVDVGSGEGQQRIIFSNKKSEGKQFSLRVGETLIYDRLQIKNLRVNAKKVTVSILFTES